MVTAKQSHPLMGYSSRSDALVTNRPSDPLPQLITADQRSPLEATEWATQSAGSSESFSPLREDSTNFVERETEFLCWETVGGARTEYRIGTGSKRGTRRSEAFVLNHDKPELPLRRLLTFFQSYVLPEGYPDSVDHTFAPYMRWRAMLYMFGGAMSVFSTRSLLHSLGVSRGSASSGAVAVNWVIKDGAGRLGKMLFARCGKKFDSNLKQMRFTGSLLLDMGAGVELATMAFPHCFLPFACAANVLKNVGAVTNTATRAPIYKAFARSENLGDITAKGESISNMADLLGTGLGIVLSRFNPPLFPTFCALSAGYLLASYHEVHSVHLPTLNNARFAVAVNSFLRSGSVPSLLSVNRKEKVLELPWAVDRPLELGARVSDAFDSPSQLSRVQRLFEDRPYLVTYRPSRRRAFVVLKEGAAEDEVVKASFQAHLLLHILNADMRKRRESSEKAGGGAAQAEWHSAGADTSRSNRERVLQAASTSIFHSPPTLVGANPVSVQPDFLIREGEVDALVEADRARRTMDNGRMGLVLRRRQRGPRAMQRALSPDDVAEAVAASCRLVDEMYSVFRSQASDQGWKIAASVLDPGDARVSF